MNYQEWEGSILETIKEDSLWRVQAYRLALFLGDLDWRDATKVMRDKRTLALLGQLYHASGSISANAAEGYSRGTGRDRARFYEYALGSARESRDWCYKGRHILGEAITGHRLQLLTEIIRILLTMIPQQRERVLREEGTQYQTALGADGLGDLLRNVPFP